MATGRTGIVVDSAANIPPDLLEQLGITVVPMVLKFGERVSLDGVDLNPSEFYDALVAERVPVSTSAPSIGDFRSAYERALKRYDTLVCVTVASFVSATHDAAVAAAREVDPSRVVVVDSRSASLGEGLPAIEAARAAAAGASLEEVAARARDIADRTAFIAAIDTFEFLRRSGRVNVLMAYAATALNIKPVFGFRRGQVEQLGRPRTRARAIERVLTEVRKAAAGGPLHIGVAHAACADEAEELVATLRREVAYEEILLAEFTPLMGAHTGPGLLGVAFWG
ncbi:MAG TPA: DegV family protein [Actinomycetota bacterium]